LSLPQPSKPKVSATEIFVNREKPLELFKKTAAIIPKDGVELLVFYGVGGQGKTALRKQFEAVLKNESSFSDIHVAVLDLHERKTIDPDLALLFIRNELAQTKKVSFPAFDLVFSFYWQKAYPEREMPILCNSWLEGGIELTSEFISDASKAVLEGAAGAVAEGVPLFGGFVKRGVSHGVKWGHEKWTLKTNEAINEAFPRGVPENPADIEEQLPFLLASDLAAHLVNNENRRFVIFIDEYERVFEERGVASKARDNPFDTAVRSLVTYLKGALIVIMSREQLPWAEFPPASISSSEWRKYILEAHHRLEGLSCIDAEKFLLLVPVPEENLRQAIIDGSGAKLGDGIGKPIFPQLLDFQVKHYFNLKSQGKSNLGPEEFAIQADSFQDLRNKLFHRLIEHHGSSFVSTIKRLSVARFFDRSLFDYIIKKFVTGFPLDRFIEFTEISFVEESKSENIFKFHNTIREILQEDLSPEDLKKTHEALIDYYTPLAVPNDSKWKKGVNVDALTELVYHKCSSAPHQVIEWWNEFFKTYYQRASKPTLIPCLRFMLETVEEACGPDHPDTATSLIYLADHLRLLSPDVQAQPLYERSLKIRETVLGPDHPDTAVCIDKLAINLSDQGKFVQAQPLLERILKIRETTSGADHPDILADLFALADNLHSQEKYHQAQPLLEHALKICETNFGPVNPDTQRILNFLAFNLFMQSKYDQAQPLLERVLKICEKNFGPENPDTQGILNFLAFNLFMQGKYDQAQPLLERVLKICETNFGPDSPDTVKCLNNLGDNLQAQGRSDEAEIYRELARKKS
jgi:tetratricopeptide (TPR) repeat protein